MISTAWILIICEKTQGPNLAEIAKSNARIAVQDGVGVAVWQGPSFFFFRIYLNPS